jgi:hypothetical protein
MKLSACFKRCLKSQVFSRAKRLNSDKMVLFFPKNNHQNFSASGNTFGSKNRNLISQEKADKPRKKP